MADRVVPFVVRLAVIHIEMMHPLGEVRLRRLDYEVIMVPHKAKSVANPSIVLDRLAEQFKEFAVVLIIEKDTLSPVAP